MLTYGYHILIQSILHNNYIPIPSYSFRAHRRVGVYKHRNLFPPSLPHRHKNLEPYRFRERKCRYRGYKWVCCRGCFQLLRDPKIASNQIDKSHCPCSRKYNFLYSEILPNFNLMYSQLQYIDWLLLNFQSFLGGLLTETCY